MEYIFDEFRGSWMTEKDGQVISVYHLIPVIRCINLETGAIRTVVDVGTDGRWSPDGCYFAFYTYDLGDNFGHNGRAILRDMQTGKKHYGNGYPVNSGRKIFGFFR